MFTKAERFLINNNKAFVITSEDSDDPKPFKDSKSLRFQETDIKTLGPHFDELFEATKLSFDPVSQPTRKVALSFRRKYDSLQRKRINSKFGNADHRTLDEFSKESNSKGYSARRPEIIQRFSD